MAGREERARERALPELLRGAHDRLAGGKQAGQHPRHEELELLLESVRALGSDERGLFEEATAALRRPLAFIVDETNPELTKRQRLALRGILRTVRAALENLKRPLSARALAREDMLLSLGRVDLAALARDLGTHFEGLAGERRVTYTIDAPARLVVDIDERKVHSVLLNLLFNAFKYTPEDGEIVLAVEEDHVDDEVLVTVTDSGPGIAAQMREAVFDHTRQIDRSIFVDMKGVGLTLGRSRDLIALHGGTMAAAPAPTSGAQFKVRLPRWAPEGMDVSARGAPDDAHLAKKVAEIAASELVREAELRTLTERKSDRALVLVVEDCASIQRILVECLRNNYDTASAFDGLDGLKKATDLEPDLIVTDLNMPRMGGEEMIRLLRAQPALSEIPILVLTGTDDPVETVRLLDAGVQDVLRKPFLLQEARARIKNLIATKQTLDVLNSVSLHHETDPLKLASSVARHQRELRTALEQVRVARDLAESASRTKSNFLRMVSHELRTPVTAMQLLIHLLLRDNDVAASPKLRECFDRIRRSSQRLVHLVDTILEWARVESGRCSRSVESFDLPHLVEEVVSEIQDYANRKKIGLHFVMAPGAVPPLHNDPRLVGLITANLVGRAVQLTERGSVDVEVQFHDGVHTLHVKDGGERIPPERSAELFEPISSSQDLRWSGGAGSGLGLFVIRDIARAIDGDISLEAVPGPGNTLSLRLPSIAEGNAFGALAPPSSTSSSPTSSPTSEPAAE
ncbi:MAG TPA: ATP-binding protein [Myxococcota bacterium]|jgi:signal transduction histidine kinase